MKKQWLIAVAFVLANGAALASDWKQYDAKAYGFSMLIPDGATVRERESSGGWGGMNAGYEGVRLHGLVRLGAPESDADIERFAVQVIGIPASQWRLIDSGTNQNGWGRYRTFLAESGSKLYFGAYGVGPKGNYLLYLETAAADYAEHKADYNKWYESIRLQ